jgi:hypothetical protein
VRARGDANRRFPAVGVSGRHVAGSISSARAGGKIVTCQGERREGSTAILRLVKRLREPKERR